MRDSYAPFRPALLEELKTHFGNSGKRFPKGTRALTRQAMFSAVRSMVTLAMIKISF
jgi:hypothetical protein